MSMIKRHIIIGSAEKISQHISQHKYKSGYERPAHPAEPPAMVCESKGLSFSSPPLIQGQCCLPPPSCCSCTRTQLGQPFEEAKALSPHNRHAEGSPYLAHYLAEETWPSFMPLSSFNSCHSRFSKQLQ